MSWSCVSSCPACIVIPPCPCPTHWDLPLNRSCVSPCPDCIPNGPCPHPTHWDPPPNWCCVSPCPVALQFVLVLIQPIGIHLRTGVVCLPVLLHCNLSSTASNPLGSASKLVLCVCACPDCIASHPHPGQTYCVVVDLP